MGSRPCRLVLLTLGCYHTLHSLRLIQRQWIYPRITTNRYQPTVILNLHQSRSLSCSHINTSPADSRLLLCLFLTWVQRSLSSVLVRRWQSLLQSTGRLCSCSLCILVRLHSITKGEFPVPNEERRKATFDRLPEYAKSMVDYQYDIGKDPSSGKFPSEKIQQNFLGEVLTPNINIHDM